MKMTDLEKRVIEYCIYNDWNDGLAPVGQPTKFIDERDVHMTPGQLSRVVSSCVKKGFVTVNGKGKDKTITLLDAGEDFYFLKKMARAEN